MEPDPPKWLYDPITDDFVQLHTIENVLYSGKTSFQRAEIITTKTFGRCLVLDGKIQSSELDESIYHEALVHPAMLAHPNPEAVLIAGGGEGATLREVLAHRSVKRVVMVDLDEEAVELCRRYLPSWHQGSFDDPRVELLHMDAREYIAKGSGKFDVAIVDLTDPMEGGPSYLLFTKEFYGLIRARLGKDGVMALQCEPTSWGIHSLCAALSSTLRSVFPSVHIYQAHIPAFGGMWGFALAGSQLDPLSWTPKELDKKIAARVSKPLEFYDGVAHLGMFALPKNLRTAIDSSTKIVTDENPSFLFH